MELQQNITKNSAYKFVLFDFDGTLISQMDINYNNMKKRIKKLLDMKENETLTPMFEIIRVKLRECFDLIDKYECDSLKKCRVNEDVLKLYHSSNPKIIITRNGRKVIEEFCLIYEVPYPDVLACMIWSSAWKRKGYHNINDNFPSTNFIEIPATQMI